MKKDLIDYAQRMAPDEMCGFVLQVDTEQVFYPVNNVAQNKQQHAVFDPDAWIEAAELGEVVAMVHSHPYGPSVLSPADRAAQVETQLPWYLVLSDRVIEYPCVEPLIGRSFEHGVSDCYTLFRDAYALAGHLLPNFERDERWWDKGENLYLDNLPKHGFYKVNSPLPGDVLLIQLASNTPNHTAIYLGNNMLLHHCPKRLSTREVCGGYWLRHLHSIWRYEAWQPSDFMGISNDLAASSPSM